MADAANTFTSLQPLMKEAYASGPLSTHKRPGNNTAAYSEKLAKPMSDKQYFSHIKKALRKAKKFKPHD